MSIKLIYNEQLMNLLNSIFPASPTEKDEFLPIIKDMKNLPNIIQFVNLDRNIKINLDNIISLIYFLKNLFCENSDLIPVFTQNCFKNDKTFLNCLIDLYLDKRIEKQSLIMIEDLIQNINFNVSISKKILKYIYQKLNYYFNINQKRIEVYTQILTESILLRYLKLLNIFYTDIKSQNNLEDKTSKSINDKIIRNYFYFNGINSGISIQLNKSSNNLNISSPSLYDGCTIIFYVNPDQELLNNYFEHVIPQNKCNVTLIKLLVGTHLLALELKDSKNMSIVIDEDESDKIDISKVFQYNSWNTIMLLIEPKAISKKGGIKVAVNESIFESSKVIPKAFNVNDKINNIFLFENFIGKVTSIVFFSYLIDSKLMTFFNKTLYGGFYKNKILFRFLHSLDKDYCKSVQNFKEYEKFKGDRIMNKIYNLNIGSKDFNKNKFFSVFCPFMYNPNTNVMDDVFGIFIGSLKCEYDGANVFSNNNKNIAKVGGINNLLPIGELMLSSLKKNSDYFVDRNLLTKSTLLEYLKIIKQIITNHRESIIELNNNYFFSSLGLFLEKYPPDIFNEQILNIFLDICKESLRYKKDVKAIQKLYFENSFANYRFMSIIIFNPKIISKFNHGNQLKIWEGIFNYFKNNIDKMKDELDMNKIINLLRFYDKNRYEKYCCKKHASLFGCNKDNEIINPDINSRIGKLADIIQLYLDKIDPEKDEINLYDSLALDLSPCLKKKIIQLYIFHFINDKISDKTKEKTLNNLLKHNYFEVTEYTLSVSILDVRSEIFKLLHIFLVKHKDKFLEYINKSSLKQNQIFLFISENIIPNNLKIISLDEYNELLNQKQANLSSAGNYYQISLFKDNLLGAYNDKNYLFYYFNKKIYEDDINALWSLLNSWMTENAPELNSIRSSVANNLSKTSNISKKDKEIGEQNLIKEDTYNLIFNPFIISFSVDFVSKVKPFYIDSFLSTMVYFLRDTGTRNKDIVIKDKKFFPWLVATIYFFHNKENENMIEEKDLIPSIQKNSLELIAQIFKLKTSLKEIENKLYYLIEYSFYLKNRFIKITNILTEIIRITRLLFETILKCSELYYNIKSIFCFEFIFLFKNCDEIFANYEYKQRRNSLLDTESLNKALKKTKDEKEKKNSRSSVTYLDYDTNNTVMDERSSLENKSIALDNNELNFTMTSSMGNMSIGNTEIAFIPNYYHQGIFSNPQNQKQSQIKKTLKNIWTDYELYSTIINYYRKNIWGAEIIFKTVKMVYDPKPDKSIFDSCQDLLKNYGDAKEYRNILLPKISKLLITDEDYKNDINKINLLYLNLILLCFSIDIAGVIEEEDELIQQIIEFLIFCILASININQNEEIYNYIQRKLYDTIYFGLLFLKSKDESKFRELMFYVIDPFFEGLSGHGNIKKILGLKKTLYRNCAIFKVFTKSDTDNTERRATKIVEISNQDIPIQKKKSSDYEDKSNMHLSPKRKKKKELLFFRGNPELIVNNIFERVLNFYQEKKNIFKNESSLILFYLMNEVNANDNNAKNSNESIIEQERKRINIFMKKFIPNIFSEIKKTSISSYLEEKKRRNNFKKIKKSLFSWNGFWSDKTLFLVHHEYLKYRIKNHYCKDMSKILLSPILDLKYYLPKFSKFDVSKLFNRDNYKYNICLNVDNILNINENDNQNENNINAQFNYLFYLYKNQYNNIWDSYYSYFIEEKNENIENNTLAPKEVFELLFQNKLNTINEENVQSENIYTCCIVKPTNHIKGYITTEKNCIKFTYCPDNESKELLEKDPSYDKDMGACFGSTFKTYYKDKDKICLEVKYRSIEYMLLRNYFYQQTGVEIFTFEKKSYFLNFKSNQELLKFIQDILYHEKFRKIKCHGYKGKKCVGYCKLFNVYNKKKNYYINYKMEEWQNHNISTFEYIMWLNIFAGRSFNDLTQYPVFPWIITNYQSETLDQENDFRNLSLPVGMFDFNEKAEMRKETFIEFYNTLKNDLKESKPDFDYKEFLDKCDSYIEHYNHKKLKNSDNQDGEAIDGKLEINQLPYYYGSHYSNPTYVSHYLTRLFPHASISIEIHGDKFDDVNRLFISMNRTFETASTLKDDIRELIPEFFVMPEMFLNTNNFNLSQDKLDTEGEKMDINHVELPPWSKNISTNFVTEMRKNLEKNNLKINKWVDLIFGYLQKGEKAEENHNIFMQNTYENMVKIDEIKDDDAKNALMRLVEVGVTPIQIFSSESSSRNDINKTLSKHPYSNSKGPFLSECTNLKSFNISMYKYHRIIQKINVDYKQNKDNYDTIFPKLTIMKAINKNELKVITNCNYWFNVKFVRNENKYTIEESTLTELINISSKYSPSYQMSNIIIPTIIFGHNKFVIRGGFWDGRIEVNYMNDSKDSKDEKDNFYYSINSGEGPVIVMEISKDENLLLCGTLSGCLIAYQIELTNNNTNMQLYLLGKIFDHNSSLNSICMNDNLNILATSSNDKIIYLYLLPTFEVFRAIHLYESNSKDNFNEEELLVANNIFLSDSPLPCVCTFFNSKKAFRSYTINGDYISEIQETNNANQIMCYKIFKDLNFCDFIIYGTDDGMVKIRSFPDMNLINYFSPFEGNEILCLEISLDKRYCYAWSKGGEIAVIKDASVNDPTEVEQKKSKK